MAILKTPTSSGDLSGLAAGDYSGVDGPLTMSQVAELTEKYGLNTVVTDKRTPWYMILLQSLLHPFNILLCIIAICSGIATIEEQDYSTAIIISVMIIISTIIRFYQELKSEGAVTNLLKLISKSVSVVRFDALEPLAREFNIPSEQLVPGDWVILRPGEVVPADGVIIKSKVFHVSQAPLTGESLPVEKYSLAEKAAFNLKQSSDEVLEIETSTTDMEYKKPKRICMLRRLCLSTCGFKVKQQGAYNSHDPTLKANLSAPERVFMGSQVISGMATVRITKTGYHTLFGKMAVALSQADTTNAFQRGVKRVSWIFFIIMAIMVPPIFLISGFTNDPNGPSDKRWMRAFLFSLSVAVGLTPEMLPMIVNANLAKGSVTLTKHNAITKKLDSVINLGAVDILCTDKTGTLTKSIVTVESFIDPYGISSTIPLQIGYLNAYFQSITQNPLDSAIVNSYESNRTQTEQNSVSGTTDSTEVVEDTLEEKTKKKEEKLVDHFSRLDELPFDFLRRRLSVLIKNEEQNEVYLVCKGAVEETLSVCRKTLKQSITVEGSSVFLPESKTIPLKEEFKKKLMKLNASYTKKGERVIAIAYKSLPHSKKDASIEDESDLIFAGFVTFIDPPKPTTLRAIKSLREHNVEVKVLTGDAPNICIAVCKSIQLPVKSTITGKDIQAAVDAGNLAETIHNATIFAKLTPLQKALVVQTLRDQHHVVAMMGDGINDAPSLKEADVGISVENGVDICRDAADIILLDKDLQVIVDAIRIGRTTYCNTIKYIAMVMSSNFGNVFSILVATAWLPFEPMTSLQVLTQNLLYDISQTAIPWDSVDEDFLLVPHKWRIKHVIRFMVFMGPWSSVFDIATFMYMYFTHDIKTSGNNDKIRLFRTAWFTVGLLTQTVIVHIIRSPKISCIQTFASLPVSIMSLVIVAAGLGVPYIPYLNDRLGFAHDPPGLPYDVYFFTAIAIFGYCVATTFAKVIYVKLFKEWF